VGFVMWDAALASVWQELYRELRRHAGDERLPARWRYRLREAGQRAHQRSLALRMPTAPYPRRRLRTASVPAASRAALDCGRAELAAAGVPDEGPLVVLEARTRLSVARAMVDDLAAAGYAVVTLGDAHEHSGIGRGVVDLAGRTLSLDGQTALLARARFAVVGSLEWQRRAYATDTPTLFIDAKEPFAPYPIQPHGSLLLATAVDLDSGRALSVDEQLSDVGNRHRRNLGYRRAPVTDVLAALHEQHEVVARGAMEHGAQRRVRDRLVALGRVLAAEVPYLAEWGPDDGFLGDGRLAQVQAERAS
jgi:hypothetical protein